MTTCAIKSCDRKVCARGWCKMHYYRWHKHGDPTVVKPPGRPAQPRPVCQYPDCHTPSKRGGRGWCGKHLTRWYRHGDPSVDGNKNRKRRDLMERVTERVTVTAADCWEWDGFRLPNGYAQLSDGRSHEYLHRAVWRYHHGPIPKGMHVHHNCKNRCCGNPAHLVLLTPLEHSAAHRKVAA